MKVGILRVPVSFEIVENLAVELLFGTSFIDKYIREIFLNDRNTLPSHSSPVPILPHNSSATVRFQISEQGCTEIPAVTIRVAQQTVVSNTPTCVAVSSSAFGLIQLDPKSLEPDSATLHVAHGIIEPT